MNTQSRIITGIIGISLGLILIVVGFFESFVLIYGIPIFIIGIFILLNKGEDDIEKIRSGKSLKGGMK